MKAVVFVLLLAFLAPAVMLVFPGVVGAERTEVVLTGSMSPAIEAGDLVVLGPYSFWDSKVRVGDIIAFEAGVSRNGEATLHRVVEIREAHGQEVYVTKGDANDSPDPQTVARHQIVGLYRFHIPAYGHIVLAAKAPLGLIAFVVLPSVLVIGHEVTVMNRLGKARAAQAEQERRGAQASGHADRRKPAGRKPGRVAPGVRAVGRSPVPAPARAPALRPPTPPSPARAQPGTPGRAPVRGAGIAKAPQRNVLPTPREPTRASPRSMARAPHAPVRGGPAASPQNGPLRRSPETSAHAATRRAPRAPPREVST